jgi:hypothetical protein
LEDLGSLDEPLWLVIDDLHELQADEAVHQVELLLASAPPQLRLVLLTRRDLRLGLHRLRLEGELTEIRGGELGFSPPRAGRAFGCRVRDGADHPSETIALDAADRGPVPAALTPRTLNLYVVPAARPVTVVNGCPLVDGVLRPMQLEHAGEGMTS